MTANNQSIKDLMAAGAGNGDGDESAGAKFQAKQKEIREKEIEKQVREKAASLGLSYINLKGFSFSIDALALIPEEKAREDGVICFYYDGEKIRLGTVDPTEEVRAIAAELAAERHCEGELYLISETSFNYAFALYRSVPKIVKIEKGVKITEDEMSRYSGRFNNLADLANELKTSSVSDIVVIIIASPLQLGASDIHIEAEESGVKVRFRIDGMLHDAAVLEKDAWSKIISRFKLLSGVKINIEDRPQDGRFSVFLKNEKIDIRSSFLPTAYGESVAMRILRSAAAGFEFEDLGLRKSDFERLKKQIDRPNGMIVATGPTGSGKTTTLYAVLRKLNDPKTKIITVEDPIEYQLEGVNQSQIGKNYGFAQALRSIVRQDPDVIMVGEIRDLETSEIAIQAALTGHLVLSTLHTNDAAGAVPRFLSMGVKPFLLAPAINAMIGQRLVRRLCPSCKTEERPDEERMARVRAILEKLPAAEKMEIDFDDMKFYRAVGCNECRDLGYRGRIGIYEIMTMSPEIEKIILSGQTSEYQMREIAAAAGMTSMVQDGLIKALGGITSLDEVFRVAEEKQ